MASTVKKDVLPTTLKQDKDKLFADILALIGEFADNHNQALHHFHLKIDKRGFMQGFEMRWKHKDGKGNWK
jgi:hypothetical protein